MLQYLISILLFMLPITGRAELLSLDETGELALSTDSIEIKNRNSKKIVQGVVYGYENGIKRNMAQFIVTCGSFGGSIQIKGYEQDTQTWIADGTSRADIIGKTACSLPKPSLEKLIR